ncbi:MAG: VanZ family protein [Thermoanaerobaculia bacterium]|nr:VanZ family protein [Thermoanaerobaculia bacterium]
MWTLVVWGLLLVPGSAVDGLGSFDFLPPWLANSSDKFVHFLLIVPLGFLLWCGWRVWGWVIGFLVTFAVASEVSQIWVPLRSAEASDVVADLLGGLLGALIARRSLVSFGDFDEEEAEVDHQVSVR